ncbi:hypothetical protein CFP56_022627 [Quercus suber]|uniref:Uncharacterized protein n=1 Tax=Quercus suber TaxID=58331 RepID=A0AAW0LYW1_QUESU
MSANNKEPETISLCDMFDASIFGSCICRVTIREAIQSFWTNFNNQVLSNLPITLRDPPYVSSKGRPKVLRQKHPKEKQLMKRRKCSICKETDHVRTNCPTHKYSGDVANTSLTPHWKSVHQQQSQTESCRDGFDQYQEDSSNNLIPANTKPDHKKR